jgi:methionyl-tRNA formyltransferase
MKTVFFGTPDFALTSLEACHSHSEVVAVVTQPDRPRGRGQKLSPCPVKARALELGFPVFSPASLRKPSEELSALREFISSTRPDLFVVTAYGNLVPENLLEAAPLGSINVHASLLPRWRGAAPIQRCLESGDLETGVCLQKMVMELDAGDVLAELRCPIASNDSAISLSARLSQMGGTLLSEFLKAPQWSGRAQDTSLVTYAAKIRKEEGHWSPSWSAGETHAKVRAFAAWPQVKARLSAGSVELKLLETSLFARAKLKNPPQAASNLVLEEGHVYLETGVRSSEHVLEILTIQAPGKGPVRAWDYFQNLGAPLSLESL